MPVNRLAFAALAVACIGAAGVGGYLASRQTAVPAVTQASATTPVSARGTIASKSTAAVQETEAVVEPSKRLAQAEAAPVASPAPQTAKRVDASARPASSATSRATRPTKKAEPLPALERSWPAGTSTSASAQNIPAPPPSVEPAAPPRAEDRVAQEAPRVPEPPLKTFEELVVPADSVIGLQSETTVTSERARIEDRVEARVTRDVRVHDMVAIPAGSRALGTVVSVTPGGKFKERARIGIRFTTLVLADGTRMPISTDTIYRDGEAPGKDSSAKMTGGAVGGAILGAILGGGKGAAIGGAVGAGAGAAGVMAGDRSQATLRNGEQVTIRLLAPVTVTVDQK